MTEHQQQLLATVEQSPAAVAVHDKAAWLAIFARYHVVEDPVGSAAHVGGLYDAASGQRGNGALSRFFDTFIAPNNIRFAVAGDYVGGHHVVRDLTIHITMSDAVEVEVPMCLLYELVEENGSWKIQRLAAHWELLPMMAQLLGKGLACLPVLAALSWRMLKLQGMGGMLGFSKAALNIGNGGKRRVRQFVDAFNRRSLADLMAQCAGDARMISWPCADEPLNPSMLLEQRGGELQVDKLLAAGDTVTAKVCWRQGDAEQRGVALFEFNRKLGRISALRLYLADAV